jgi:hypothetical protein
VRGRRPEKGMGVEISGNDRRGGGGERKEEKRVK